MAKWADLQHCADPVVRVTEEDLIGADVYVDALLRGRGIDPEDVASDAELVRNLAVADATLRACGREAADPDGVLWRKSQHYRELRDGIARVISRVSLGLADTAGAGTGYGSARLGRG